jgi:hypothetical protein
MQFIQQHESVSQRRQILIQMVDAADYATPRTGLVLAVQIVKPGSTQYVSSGATVVEIGYAEGDRAGGRQPVCPRPDRAISR